MITGPMGGPTNNGNGQWNMPNSGHVILETARQTKGLVPFLFTALILIGLIAWGTAFLVFGL